MANVDASLRLDITNLTGAVTAVISTSSDVPISGDRGKSDGAESISSCSAACVWVRADTVLGSTAAAGIAVLADIDGSGGSSEAEEDGGDLHGGRVCKGKDNKGGKL